MWSVARSDLSIGVMVLEAAIESARPNWLPDADELVLDSPDLPEDLTAAAVALDLERDAVAGCVHHVWAKVDNERRAEVGLAGELALLHFLRTLPGDAIVRHVAADSDGYGYDIDLVAQGGSAHLEVKSTTRRGRLVFYLSRNEYDVMLRDSCWVLLVALLDEGRDVVALGVVDREWIRSSVPLDRSARGRWQSVRLEPVLDAVRPGLSDALPWLAEPWAEDHPARSGLLGGRPPAWFPDGGLGAQARSGG
ncbi:hypothetical protein Acsp02_44440 [Actinoplanes sp. NBRC 103695]|nr:hypothetical protein Acsp02_44440 [Actinoplanes sp. NBRC 103695]